MARDVLAVPATSVDVERLFSQGRNAISHNRHRLSAQTITDIMFCRSAVIRNTEKLNASLAKDYADWCGDTRIAERWDSVHYLSTVTAKQHVLPEYSRLFDDGNENLLHETIDRMCQSQETDSDVEDDDLQV